MLRVIYAFIFLIAVTCNVNCQFYDFFSAYQPTLRPLQLDITTKRSSALKISNGHDPSRTDDITRLFPYNLGTFGSDVQKQRSKNTQTFFDDSTTIKAVRKTTKRVSNQRDNSRDISRNRTPKDPNTNSKENRRFTSENLKTSNSKIYNEASQTTNNNDRLTFDDGKRNTIINYEVTRPSYTTKRQEYETKKHNAYHTTQYPFTNRPARPAVVNGPPITNKPVTQRPSFGSRPDDTSISPELIIGPDEDYMTSVEKKRYIEIAERMCDRYKALDIKEVLAIPLVPSPDVVKVNVSTCTPSTVPLVIGGKVVTVNEFPHMALLGWPRRQDGGYSWKCGGSLVSDKYVLTAAHCVYQEKDNNVLEGAPRAVQLGTSYLNSQSAVIKKVAAVIRHPKYKLPKSYYDIALVKMTTTVTFSNEIRPACLGVPPSPGLPIIATGWGRTEFGGEQSQELRSVSLPVWDMTECYNALGTSRKIPDGPSSDSQICAGEKKGGKDTCQGDSGGPAQIQDGCIWRVVAVTSLGRSCGAPHTPALYARVQRAFISAVIFEDQTIKNKPTQTDNQQSNNDQWNTQQSNQQTNIERNKNEQNTWNRDSSIEQFNNNHRRNEQNSGNVYNNDRDQQNNGYFNQNSNRQYNNNDYTTARPVNNKPQRGYYNYESNVSNYQSDNNPYNSARVWWT